MNKQQIKISIYDNYCTPSQVVQGNGDAILDPICISAITDEYLETGEYYLDATFIVDKDGLWKHIKEESILKVQMDYGNEYFRIAKVQSSSDYIVVFARQETIHQTLHMWLTDVRPENRNGQSALTHIKENSIGKKDITVISDISDLSTAYYMDMNVYEALHTCDQSFINRWGGEVQRRGYTLTINKKIGTHRGVQIRSNKNLTGFESNTDIDNVVTRIKPKGYDGITIDGFVDSPLINNYPFIKTKEIKYDDVKVKDADKEDDEGFDTLAEAQAELIRLAELEFSQNHIDTIQATYNINFIQLEQTEEYKNYTIAEKVYLGDEIDVHEENLNIDITVRAIRRQYNILTQRVIEIELNNEVTANKPPTIGDILDNLNKIEENIKEHNDWYKESINNATDLINNGLKDSYVIVRKNEILIMDTTDINTATKVWRWTNGGFGYSNTGYYGTYETAITMDGSIVGKFITGLVVNGNQINARELRVVKDDGMVTFEVTPGGDVNLNVNSLKIIGKSVAMEDDMKTSIEQAIKDANNYSDKLKDDLSSEISDVNSSLDDLNNTMYGTFKDGIIDETEANSISERIIQLDKESSDLETQYQILYTNDDLVGNDKTNLYNARNDYNTKYNNLKNYINTAISDKKITDVEQSTINTRSNEYNTSLSNFNKYMQLAIDSIANKKKNDAINESNEFTANQIETVNNTISSLEIDINDIAASVKTIETTTTKLDTWISDNKKNIRCNDIGIRVNYSSFGTQNTGYLYIHGYMDNTAYDLGGYIYTNGKSQGINKGSVDFNSLTKDMDYYLCIELGNKNLFVAYYDSGYKYKRVIGGTDSGDLDLTKSYIAIGQCRLNSSSKTFEYSYLYQTPQKLESVLGISNIETRLKSAELKITDESITNTVKQNFYTKTETEDTIIAKGYQTSSQVQQTVDKFELKFEQSGGYNLLRNSAFKNKSDYWSSMRWDQSAGGTAHIEVVYPEYNEWTPSNRNSLGARVSGLTSDKSGVPLRAGFDSHKFNIKSNTTYTLNCLMACHRAESWTIEMLCYDSNGNRLMDNNHSVVVTNNNYFGGRDRNNWKKIKHTWTTQSNAATCHLRVFMNEWNGEQSTAFVWICEPIIVEGDLEVPWTPNADELYAGITTIDRDGVKVQHESGSYSQLNAKELHQTNENGNKTISIRYGALRTYQFNRDNNNATGFLGGVSSLYSSNLGAYGTGLFGSAHSQFTSFGFSESLEDNQHSEIITWLRCQHYGSSTYPEAGIYTFKPLHIRQYSNFFYRPRMYYGINFPYEDREDLNKEISFISTSSNASPGTRYLSLYGADGIQLGVQNGGQFMGHRMTEDLSAAKLHHDAWGDWNFNGWSLNNARVTYSLSNPTAELGTKERQFTRDSYAIMSTTQLIQERGEDSTLDGQCVVEIPDDIKYNINKYDVNIIKYGPGDIWVSKREYDYFIVESENDIKFTWVLEGQLIESMSEQSIPYQHLSYEDISCTNKQDDISSIPASKYSIIDDEEIKDSF